MQLITSDSSIYGALVWLSQPWNMRYPLIEFHGNNGSRDGDSQASARYTECRLSKIGEEALRDIKKDCIDWQSAYTNDEDEPVYLPGGIPNLLINGTSGIAVAMACSFAPHNIKEILEAVKYDLQNPEATIDELLNFIQGPDFPTEGLIINKNELISAYKTGKGRVRIRGEYVVEIEPKTNLIVFTSIPYKVSKESLIIDIDKLCESGELSHIVSIRDESNKDGVRFVVEIDKKADPSLIVKQLFKNTKLETTYSINQIALVDKKPKLLNLKDLIQIYYNHQKKVLLKKTEYDIKKIEEKIEVVKGLLIALEDIDNIIKLIKNSESSLAAKVSLIGKYNLSEKQAKAILDMKLSKLAKLEYVEIKNQLESLLSESKRLNGIISNPTPTLIKFFDYLIKNYGDERKTKIIQIDKEKEEEIISTIEPEDCIVVLTTKGDIKRIPSNKFIPQKRNGKGVKNDNSIFKSIKTNTIEYLSIFTNKGKMYKILVNNIIESTNSGKGSPISSLIDLEIGEIPSAIFASSEKDYQYVLFTTKNGRLKKTKIEEYKNIKKGKGIASIKIKEDDELVSVCLLKKGDNIITVTKNGQLINLKEENISPSSRVTMGIKAIKLKEDDYCIKTLINENYDSIAVFTDNSTGKVLDLSDFPISNIRTMGTKISKTKINDIVLFNSKEENYFVVIGSHNTICISSKEVPKLSKEAVGLKLIKDDEIISVNKI